MLVRRRCIPLPLGESEGRGAESVDWRTLVEDAGDGPHWGGADLVFEGP